MADAAEKLKAVCRKSTQQSTRPLTLTPTDLTGARKAGCPIPDHGRLAGGMKNSNSALHISPRLRRRSAQVRPASPISRACPFPDGLLDSQRAGFSRPCHEQTPVASAVSNLKSWVAFVAAFASTWVLHPHVQRSGDRGYSGSRLDGTPAPFR